MADWITVLVFLYGTGVAVAAAITDDRVTVKTFRNFWLSTFLCAVWPITLAVIAFRHMSRSADASDLPFHSSVSQQAASEEDNTCVVCGTSVEDVQTCYSCSLCSACCCCADFDDEDDEDDDLDEEDFDDEDDDLDDLDEEDLDDDLDDLDEEDFDDEDFDDEDDI